MILVPIGATGGYHRPEQETRRCAVRCQGKKFAVVACLVAVIASGGLAARQAKADAFAEAIEPIKPFFAATGADFLGDEGSEGSGWRVDPGAKAATRAELTGQGIARVRLIGFEYELIAYAGGSAAYYLRGFLSIDAGAEFIGLEGRRPEGEDGIYVSGSALAAFVGESGPLGDGARALIAHLQGPQCADLRFADPATFMADIQTPRFREIARGQIEGAGALPQICRDFAGLNPAAIDLRIDDVAFVALDAAGDALGVVQTDMALGRFGRLEVDTPRYRGF